jgi:2-phospho-L-lactate guanylyltransferase
MSVPRDIWAVVPIKTFTAAKDRLSGAFAPAFRQELAQTMAEDVLDALAQAKSLAGIVVVTVDAAATSIARRYGARIVTDGAESGHTGAVTAAARLLRQEGRNGMLAVPGDIPGVTAMEIERLVAIHAAAPAFTIAPAHDGRGSNAVLISSPDAVPLAFGNDSFRPHLAAARAQGIAPHIVTGLPGIGLDIDNPADLAAFAALDRPCRTTALLRAGAQNRLSA